MPKKQTLNPEDLDPDLRAQAEEMFADQLSEQPESPDIQSRSKKGASKMPSNPNNTTVVAGNPLKDLENMAKSQYVINTMTELNMAKEASISRATQLAAQGGVPQPQPQNPYQQPINPYGMPPQGVMPGGAPPAQQLPIPITVPVGADGKPDPQAMAYMAAAQNPNMGMLLLLPQLMAAMGGGKGGNNDAVNGLIQSMTALQALKQGEAPPPAGESSTDILLKAITTINALKPPEPAKGPELSEVDKLTAQLQFMKGIMEMSNIQKPATSPDGGAQMFTALTGFMAQQAAQNQEMMRQQQQQQLAIMQGQVEWYKQQAAQASQQPDLMAPFRMVEEYAQAFQKIGAFQNPQAQDPKLLLEIKRLELDQAKQAHQEALDTRKSEGWQNMIGNGLKSLTDALGGSVGQNLGEGLKESLKLATQAQLDGRPMQFGQGPIVQVPPTPQPQYMPPGPIPVSQQPYMSPGPMPQQFVPPQPLPAQPLAPAPPAPPTPAAPLESATDAVAKVLMRPGGSGLRAIQINEATRGVK